MKILLAIPHFYRPQGQSRHAALRTEGRQLRLEIFQECLGRIYRNWIGRKLLLCQHNKSVILATNKPSIEVKIAIVIHEEDHFLRELDSIPDVSFEVVRANCEPLHLGFAAHQVLLKAFQNEIDKYDYFGYLEDDLLIEDIDFFIS